MAGMNDIKARIKSVGSTMQITKAMELVATSKLRRARENVEASRPFHEILKRAIGDIEASVSAQSSVWSRPSEGKRTLIIVIAGDRGLAGGYNSNVFRLAQSLSAGTDAVYMPIGKKAVEHYRHKGNPVYKLQRGYVNEVSVGDCFAISEEVAESFKSGEVDRVVLVYTRFASMISQIPTYEQLLPLENSERSGGDFDPLCSSDGEEMLDKIVPQYIGGILNTAIKEALASESGARRTAMNAANKNASEMIDSLMLSYNRARQAVITQEITEIVSGSEAL